MTSQFPHVYCATVTRMAAARARVEVLDRDSEGSPENLVLASLGICMLTTFETFAAQSGIELHAWTAHINGTVEPTPEGLRFTSIVLGIDLEIDGAIDRVEQVLEDAKQHCLVLNSLRVPVVIETQIHTPYDDRAQLPDGAPSYVAAAVS